MIVCHCKAVSERAIREAVRRGARSPREVALACQAGRQCGGCRPLVRDLIACESGQAEDSALPVAAAG